MTVPLFKDAFWSTRSGEETQNLPEGLFTSSDKRVHLDPLQGAGKGSVREMDQVTICFIVEPLSIITASINIQKNKTRNFFFFFLVTMQMIKPVAGDRPALETVFSAGLKSLPPPSGEAPTVWLLLLTVIVIAWFIITQESAGLIGMDHIYSESKHIKPHYGFWCLAWLCARYIHSDDFIV